MESSSEGLRLYSSYQEAVDIDGEAIEFEWKIFPGFTSWQILQEIQRDLARKNIQPKEFKDRIVFLSMFNDIGWKKSDDNCTSNVEKVKNYAMKFSQGHWTFLGPESDTRKKDSQQNDTAIQRNWSSCVQEYQCFQSWDLEWKLKGESTIHFNGD